MNRWRVVIEAWPHSTGKGQTNDQAAAGEAVQTYHVKAYDIAAALVLAKCIVEGIEANPAVWQAPIKSITQVPFE
jgi:hypothetical protein